MEHLEHNGDAIPHLPDWDWFLDCLRQEDNEGVRQSGSDANSPGSLLEAGAADWTSYM